MPRTFTAPCITRYEDKSSEGKNLLGVITLNGKSLKVWRSKYDGDRLHQVCKRMAAVPNVATTYTFRHSDKWGDALETIERDPVAEYDAARAVDESQLRSHKQGGFIAEQISKSVQATVDAERKAGQ